MALALTIVLRSPALYPPVLAVTGGVSTLFGMPILLLLRRTGPANWLTVSAGGFVTGAALPALFVVAGPISDQASSDGVITVAAHHYTVAGWAQNLKLVGTFGGLGVAGALICWMLIAWLTRGAAAGRYHRRRGVLIAAIAAAAVIGLPLASLALIDRSCHSPLRYVERAPLAGFKIRVPREQWPALNRELEAEARSIGWSYWNDVRPDPGFPWFQASLCTEPGIQFFVLNGDPASDDLILDVFTSGTRDGWQASYRQVQARIARRWPGSVVPSDESRHPPSPSGAGPSPSPAPS